MTKNSTPRREQPGTNVGRRVTMATRGSSSVRATFHNVPIDLHLPVLTNLITLMLLVDLDFNFVFGTKALIFQNFLLTL